MNQTKKMNEKETNRNWTDKMGLKLLKSCPCKTMKRWWTDGRRMGKWHSVLCLFGRNVFFWHLSSAYISLLINFLFGFNQMLYEFISFVCGMYFKYCSRMEYFFSVFFLAMCWNGEILNLSNAKLIWRDKFKWVAYVKFPSAPHSEWIEWLILVALNIYIYIFWWQWTKMWEREKKFENQKYSLQNDMCHQHHRHILFRMSSLKQCHTLP